MKVCPAFLNIDGSGGVCRPGDDLSDIQPQMLEARDSLCTSFLLEIYHNRLCLIFRMRLLVEHYAARFSTSSLQSHHCWLIKPMTVVSSIILSIHPPFKSTLCLQMYGVRKIHIKSLQMIDF